MHRCVGVSERESERDEWVPIVSWAVIFLKNHKQMMKGAPVVLLMHQFLYPAVTLTVLPRIKCKIPYL